MLTNQRLSECGYLKGARAESLLELSCIETRVWLVLSTACVSVFTGTIAGLLHLSKSMGLINCNENSLPTESLAVHRNAKSRWGVRKWGVVSLTSCHKLARRPYPLQILHPCLASCVSSQGRAEEFRILFDISWCPTNFLTSTGALRSLPRTLRKYMFTR